MWLRPRVIPCLSLIDDDLVKTKKFKKPRYIGDPINAVKIFNGKMVDELCILDIRASRYKKSPKFELLSDIASEAFMPLSYGGGITSIKEVEKLFNIGYEKIIFNTAFVENQNLIEDAISYAGGQSIIVSIDVKKNLFGKYDCYIKGGTKRVKGKLDELLRKAENIGVGEIFLNCIDHDGGMNGYDFELIRIVSSEVSTPIIACGGANNISDLKKALDNGAHAAAAGSMFIYQGLHNAVLINFPNENELFKLGVYKC